MKKLLSSLLILSLVASPSSVLAKDSDKSKSKADEKMPVYASASQTSGYDKAKKEIEKTTKDPSIKEQVKEAVKDLRDDIKDLRDDIKDLRALKREAPKDGPTDPNPVPNPNPGLPAPIDFVKDWTVQADVTDEDGNVFVTYLPTGPSDYDYVVVKYDALGNPLKADSSKTVVTTVMPDLTGLFLIFTSDTPSEVVLTYADDPTEQNVSKYVVLFYNPPTAFNHATVRTITPIDLTRTVNPAGKSYYKELIKQVKQQIKEIRKDIRELLRSIKRFCKR